MNIHQIIIRTYIWSKLIPCLGSFVVKSTPTLLIVPRWDNKRFRTQASKKPGSVGAPLLDKFEGGRKKIEARKKKNNEQKKERNWKNSYKTKNYHLSSKNMRWDGYLWEKLKPSLIFFFFLHLSDEKYEKTFIKSKLKITLWVKFHDCLRYRNHVCF